MCSTLSHRVYAVYRRVHAIRQGDKHSKKSAASRCLHLLEPGTLRLAAASSADCASCCLHARYSSSACTCAALRFLSSSRLSTACWSCCTCVVRSWTFACSRRMASAGRSRACYKKGGNQPRLLALCWLQSGANLSPLGEAILILAAPADAVSV